MNTYQAKQIPIQGLLDSLGHKPVKVVGTDVWYHSPLRSEDTASFKLNQSKNTWYDFGLGEGGTIIDLVCTMYGEDVRGALGRLERSNFSGARVLPSTQKNLSLKEKRELILLVVKPLSYLPLLNYLQSRCIDLDVAKKYCDEVSYKLSDAKTVQKAIGFKNDWGDYEIRNKLFKSLLGSSKRITSIDTENHRKIAVFEGFFDFLSFVSRYKNKNLECGYIILNSTSNKMQAIHKLIECRAENIYFYLDNDSGGDECYSSLSINSSYQSFDMRDGYKDFSDYNDYYIDICKKRGNTL